MWAFSNFYVQQHVGNTWERATTREYDLNPVTGHECQLQGQDLTAAITYSHNVCYVNRFLVTAQSIEPTAKSMFKLHKHPTVLKIFTTYMASMWRLCNNLNFHFFCLDRHRQYHVNIMFATSLHITVVWGWKFSHGYMVTIV